MPSTLLTLAELKACGSAEAALKEVQRKLEGAEPTSHNLFYRGLMQRLECFPSALTKDVAAGGASVGLSTPASGWPIVALAKGSSARLKFRNVDLALVDP